MQVEVLRAVLHFGQFDYTDQLLLNVTTSTGCGQFQCEHRVLTFVYENQVFLQLSAFLAVFFLTILLIFLMMSISFGNDKL